MAKTTIIFDVTLGAEQAVKPTAITIRPSTRLALKSGVVLPAATSVLIENGTGTRALEPSPADGSWAWTFQEFAPGYVGPVTPRIVPASSSPVNYRDLLEGAAPPAEGFGLSFAGLAQEAAARAEDVLPDLQAYSAQAQDDIAELIAQAQAAILEAQLAVGVLRINIGTDLGAARPDTPLPVEWTYTGAAGSFPANIKPGDYYVRIAPTPIPFDFNQLPGYGGDYDARSLIGNIADGANVTSWPDSSGNGHPLVPASGTNVAAVGKFDADAFGASPNIPGVVLPSRSAMQQTAALGYPKAMLTCAAVKFRDVGTAATETLNTFGGQPNGRFAIARVGTVGTDQRLRISSVDGSAYYDSAIGDYRGELSLIGWWTPSVQRLYLNGNLIIEHNETVNVTLPQMASFRLGIVATNSDTGLVKAMIDGAINRFVWAAPDDTSYLTSERVATITAKLNSLMGA